MSGRGTDFLENWIQQNFTEADKLGSHERAMDFADKRIAHVAASGFTIDDAELKYRKIWAAMHNKPERVH